MIIIKVDSLPCSNLSGRCRDPLSEEQETVGVPCNFCIAPSETLNKKGYLHCKRRDQPIILLHRHKTSPDWCKSTNLLMYNLPNYFCSHLYECLRADFSPPQTFSALACCLQQHEVMVRYHKIPCRSQREERLCWVGARLLLRHTQPQYIFHALFAN